MNRRKAIKQLALATGGLITLPQWMISCGVGDTTIHATSFSSTEQRILVSVTDTIIPAGGPSGIGASSMEVDKFLQKLIDDCYEKEVQDNVKKQLKALQASAKAHYDKPFTDCSQKQRQELLMKFSASNNNEEKDFFTLMKSETIRGFNTSKKVMQEYHNYKVAPGYYYGCVDVKA